MFWVLGRRRSLRSRFEFFLNGLFEPLQRLIHIGFFDNEGRQKACWPGWTTPTSRG